MLKTFARMLGLPLEAAEDALQSPRLAQAVLSRRGFIAGATALLVQQKTFGFLPQEVCVPQAAYQSPWQAARMANQFMTAWAAYVTEEHRTYGNPDPQLLALLDQEPPPLPLLEQQAMDQLLQQLQQGTYSF